MRTRPVLLMVLLILFLLGLYIAVYPKLEGAKLNEQAKETIQLFYEERSKTGTIPESAETPPPAQTDVGVSVYKELYEAMQAYNQKIWENRQTGLSDAWSYQASTFHLTDYGCTDEVLGVVAIPKLGVELPIYLGATEENMARGAAHLSQTSLPVGGENTNCVIAGHCGYGGADYFRYLSTLTLGDEVLITTPWGVKTYAVVQTKIILPNDIDSILIQQGRELLTLLTCHPYASGGKYRFLAICEPTPDIRSTAS